MEKRSLLWLSDLISIKVSYRKFLAYLIGPVGAAESAISDIKAAQKGYRGCIWFVKLENAWHGAEAILFMNLTVKDMPSERSRRSLISLKW